MNSRMTAAEVEAISKRNRDARVVREPIRNQDGKATGYRRADGSGVYLPKPSEHDEQAALIQWWDVYGPTRGYDPRLLFAIPNGRMMPKATRGRLKAEGGRAGVPDLKLAVARNGVHGLYIEMKRRGGRKPEDTQLSYHELLRAQGYRVVACFGADEARAVILGYLA